MASGCKIYVGNLPWKYDDDSLAQLLQDMGYDFASAKVINDRETGKSRGFAFVELRTPQAAREAIENLDGHVVDGRPLRVSEANEKPRPGRGGGHREEHARGRVSRSREDFSGRGRSRDEAGFDWDDL